VSPWIIVSFAIACGGLLLLLCRFRARPTGVEEALPWCPIAELEAGRFRIVGRVIPIATSPSLVDGADCVYLERAEYRAYGNGFVPVMREVEHRAECHPFYLEDASGRILIDPAITLIDCATAVGDGGLIAERRLRAGEEVALAATFQPSRAELEEGEGPYRASARQWEAIEDDAGPPRLSHRTEDGMIRPPPDGLTAFLGGAGAILMGAAILLGFVMAFLS
jgi:hypothetical protein